ncbi:Flp pilus assembly complex ATPase component TadA [Candidatus Sumerlaeota bacterium]|nr:Flp pilus assembly complex ATPase component TadA [Candidatus Sumerlaeota bacterium]
MIQTTDNQLGQLLVEMGKLDPDMLDVAIRDAHKSNERLETVVVKMGLCEEEDVLQAVAKSLHLPYKKLGDLEPGPESLGLVTPQMADHYRIVPLDLHDGVLTIATSDPHDLFMIDELRRQLNVEVEVVVATRLEIEKAYNRIFGIGGAVIQNMTELEAPGAAGQEISLSDNIDIDEMAADATIVRFVNQLIQEAMRDRATDIHVEPMEKELRIRYRIDGMLYEAPIPPAIKRFQAAIISRLKIMADLNIAERRLPQDGKIKVKMGDKEFDLRTATVPTPYGESIAIRILSRDSEMKTMEKLGFSERHKSLMRAMIQKPYGIIFVTGPTGSGKSTTLFAALSEINSVDRKIITIEDPIEYRIPGVTQIQVNPSIDLTFARVLRTTLRLDPDVIMVGETRDPETAKITIATAMTGHLVFSTLHTNDACGAFTRLNDMGVEPFLIASSVEGVLAQRLVRVLCPECKQRYTPDAELIRQVNMTRENPANLPFMRPAGCESCRYTGYAGRTAIMEMVRMDEFVRRRIVANSSASEIKGVAMKQGMKPIRFDGWEKIKSGVSTCEEVLRVTMEDEFNNEYDASLTAEEMPGHDPRAAGNAPASVPNHPADADGIS